MKNELSVLPSINALLDHTDETNPQYSLLSGFCNEFREAHMELGICVANDCDDFDCVDRIRKVMNILAESYRTFNEIVEELYKYESVESEKHLSA